MTYTVELSDVEVSDKLYDALMECCDGGGKITGSDHSEANGIAYEWMSGNIFENDAMEWDYEIEDFEYTREIFEK